VVPETFSRADVVANLQRVALLTAAFATGHGELLATGVEDRLHQPYRAEVCPLLKKLLPLSGKGDILSVTLSGAGPSVLMLIQQGVGIDATRALVLEHVEGELVEIIECGMQVNAALIRSGAGTVNP
jgi:homoserine kinase